MLTQYNLKMPHAVYGGENAMDNVTAIIRARGAKKVAMFTDKGIEGAGLFALPEEAVKAAGADYYVLDDLPAEPSYMAVQKLVDEFKHSGADLIVACGGGSVMDAAKLASVLVTDEYGVKELLDDPGRAQKCVPIVLIPTTAGTGAEVTPNAIVAVPEKELKVGIVNEHMIADYVILDARMIKNLPRKIAAATGVDALAHCIECFTSSKANPFSDLYALEGLDLILNNIEAACDDPEAVDMPIVLYNIPARTGNALAPATVARLAQIDNIVGAKDSSGNFTNILAYIDAGNTKKNGKFSTLSGNDQLIIWNLLAGGTGGIAGCANVYPHTMASIYDLFMEGRIEEAKAANASIASFRACFKYGNPNTIVKTAVAMLGYNVGKCRAPFNQVPEEGIKALEKVLKENAEKGMC